MKSQIKKALSEPLITKFTEELGDKILIAKRRQKITNEELSQITGLTIQSIHNTITGKTSNIEAILLILDCLDIDLKIRNREGYQERREKL